MKLANAGSNASPWLANPDCLKACLSQYEENGALGFCIPPCALKASSPFLGTTYRVLLKTKKNRIAWFEINGDAPPDSKFIARIASAIDLTPLFPESAAKVARGRIQYEHDIFFLNENFFDQAHWKTVEWVEAGVLEDRSNRPQLNSSENLKAATERTVTEYLNDCLCLFEKQMDMEASRVALSAQRFQLNLYNFLASPDLLLRRNRLQAIKAYPFLAERILLKSYSGVRAAIDSGDSLVQAIADRFAIPFFVAKKLCRFPSRTLFNHLNKPDILWPLFEHVAPEKIPVTDDDWMQFAKISRRIAVLTKQPINTVHNKRILAECLSSEAARRILEPNSWEDNLSALRSFIQAVVAVTRYVLCATHSAKDAGILSVAVEGALIARIGLARIVKMSLEWDRACREADKLCAGDRTILNEGSWMLAAV